MDVETIAIVSIGVAILIYLMQHTNYPSFDSVGDLNVNTSDPNLPPGITAFARAIATAEGFYVAGSIPATYNNPGDLKLGDIGFGTGPTGITKFDTPDHGWNALYHQLEIIANGTTHAGYTLDMNFSAMADKWAEGDQNWATNVSAYLGTSVDTQIGDFLT